nr:hypothetical protein [Methylomarinum sp. Ch1-1]MDP4521081.1 hypothetical protein [Methylomarinum sp. Ch1-1]
MPYFEKHKVFFIHIPKNAGMFVEKQFGIPQEIVTYEQPTDKKCFYRTLKDQYSSLKKGSKLYDLEKNIFMVSLADHMYFNMLL